MFGGGKVKEWSAKEVGSSIPTPSIINANNLLTILTLAVSEEKKNYNNRVSIHSKTGEISFSI